VVSPPRVYGPRVQPQDGVAALRPTRAGRDAGVAPVYRDGTQVRDLVQVDDFVAGRPAARLIAAGDIPARKVPESSEAAK
jgi:nucleoside-diphosphate-sugar epimerase